MIFFPTEKILSNQVIRTSSVGVPKEFAQPLRGGNTDKFAAQRSKLAEEIDFYSDAVPKKIKSVGITLRYPVFSDLTPDQLDYYLYWRSTLGTPEFKKAAEGYCWLLVCELINCKDKSKGSELLNELVTSAAIDYEPYYPELLEVAIDYSVVNNTPLPKYSEWMDKLPEFKSKSRYLAHPVSDLPGSFVDEYVGGLFTASSDPGLMRLIGTVLRKYDSLLTEKGKGSLREVFCRETKESLLPFEGFVYLGKKIPLERICWVPDTEKMEELLGFISLHYYGRSTDSFRLEYKDELASFVDEIKENKTYSESPRIFTKENEVIYRMFGTEREHYGAACFCDPHAKTTPGWITLGDILTYGPMLPTIDVDFITSDYEHPSYSDLSREQIAYFLRWKNEFSKGRYLDTDNGYLNLYITELINTDKGKDTQKILLNLHKVYGDVPSSPLGRILADHAMVNDIPFGDYRIIKDRWVINKWIDSFVNGTNEVPLTKEILDIMRLGSISASYLGSDIPLVPFTNSIRRILKKIAAKGDMDSALDLKIVPVKRSVYFGYEYLRGSQEKVAYYADYLSCKKFIRLIDKTANYLLDSNDDSKRKKSLIVDGMDCSKIILEECQSWKTSKAKTEIASIVLNLESIKQAQQDLDSVTEMMKVDEEPEEGVKTPKKELTLSDTEGPWETLSKMLDEGERKYLFACLENADTKPILRELKITRNKIEDSINSKALDTVGDTVIEDGVPVEDYAEELRRGL